MMLKQNESNDVRLGGRVTIALHFSTLVGVFLVFGCLVLSYPGQAQFAPQDGLAPKVPQGAGACSIQKSCADLAPDMIKSAEGPSPLQENLHYLDTVAGQRPSGSAELEKTAAWAVQQFRQAHAEEVHIEKFAPPTGAPAAALAAVHPENVIAEIAGREKPDDYVIVATHLDNSTHSSGADNNNLALLIDAERVIYGTGTIPRRSIRFILFSGYGQGMLGSWAYVKQHSDKLDKIVAVISFDGGVGPMIGYALSGRSDLVMPLRDALEPIHSLGSDKLTMDTQFPSDSFDFLLEGIPTLEAERGATHPQINRAADIALLKKQVATVAITAFALADSPTRIGSRLSRPEISTQLKSAGLEQRMQAQGLWKSWTAGARGRTP